MISRINFRIQTIYGILRPSEKKVADYILNYQDSIEDISMVKIANEANVSQPTIMRFVKAIGYDSFKQFKYELLKINKKEIDILYGFSINKDDKLDELPAKIIGTTIKKLENILKSISINDYKEVIELIHQSNRISIYCVENSKCVASDLMTKLLYLGKKVTCYDDDYLQYIDANNLTSGDLAIGISYSGNSKHTVEALKSAKKADAKTIAIVNFDNTLLTKYADVVLYTSDEQFLYGDTIFSRTTQITLVDMIYMGVILKDYDKYTKKLDCYSKLIASCQYLQ